jgi:hypothetical protein
MSFGRRCMFADGSRDHCKRCFDDICEDPECNSKWYDELKVQAQKKKKCMDPDNPKFGRYT